MNVSAPLFSENRFEQEMKQQEAELYSRLYPMAAEDFTSVPDVQQFANSVAICFEKLQAQVSNLFRILSSHTHVVPPHTHPIEPHIHPTSAPGAPTGPNIGAMNTLPITLSTNTPVEGGSITWTSIPTPALSNSTGAIPNIEGNRITIGPSAIGPLITGPRRMKQDPKLLAPSIPPILNGNIV